MKEKPYILISLLLSLPMSVGASSVTITTELQKEQQFDLIGERTPEKKASQQDRQNKPSSDRSIAEKSDDAKQEQFITQYVNKLESHKQLLASKMVFLTQASDYSKLNAKKDIDAHIEKAKIYLKAIAVNTKFLEHEIRPYCIKIIEEIGLSEKDKRTFLHAFDNTLSHKFKKAIAIGNYEKEKCLGVIEQLTVLNENFGHWHYDAKTETPVFAEGLAQAVLDKYNAGTDKILKAQKNQKVILKQLNPE